MERVKCTENGICENDEYEKCNNNTGGTRTLKYNCFTKELALSFN